MSKRCRPGLTLMELVVVLLILSIMTLIAVQATDHVVDQGRFDANQRILQSLQDATSGGPNSQGAGGGADFAGFAADMGRMPQAAVDARGNVLTLRELWDGLAPGPVSFPFALRSPSDDAQVVVPCGWRGPYLRLPVGASVLRDGWSREIANPYPATGTGSLLNAAGGLLTEPGQAVFGAISLGKDGLTGGTDEYNADRGVTLLPGGSTAASFAGAVQGQVYLFVRVFDKDGTELTDKITGKVTIKVYFPYQAASASPAVIPATAVFVNPTFAIGPDANGVVSFKAKDFTTTPADLLPKDADGNPLVPGGPRVIRAYLTELKANGIDIPALSSAPITINVRPGYNVIPRITITGTHKLT